jgi:hypothetical protein
MRACLRRKIFLHRVISENLLVEIRPSDRRKYLSRESSQPGHQLDSRVLLKNQPRE